MTCGSGEPAAGLPADLAGAVVVDQRGTPVEQQEVEMFLVRQA